MEVPDQIEMVQVEIVEAAPNPLHWVLAGLLLTAVFVVVLRLSKWRFSLRTLLIGMTALAVALGLTFWAAN